MKKVTWPYILLAFIGLILLISAIVDIVYNYEFLSYILGTFFVIIIMIIILIILQSKKPKITKSLSTEPTFQTTTLSEKLLKESDDRT